VLDTNVLIFDTFEDSEFHLQAASTLDSIERWTLPGIVFHELIWFFKVRKIEPSRTRTKVEEYIANEKASFSPCTADDVRFAVTRMKNYTEYNDLIVLSTAKRLGLPLFTFDEELKKSAKENSVRVVRP
jgi:predicted nucleic acid-binding protein